MAKKNTSITHCLCNKDCFIEGYFFVCVFSPHSGPFSPVEMCEWFQAGYFTMTLLVKRGCDEGFQPLGDVIKMWGRVPFSPGPSPPPLLVRDTHTGIHTLMCGMFC